MKSGDMVPNRTDWPIVVLLHKKDINYCALMNVFTEYYEWWVCDLWLN